MPTFDVMTSREQRATSCNRNGVATSADAFTHVDPNGLFQSKGILRFESSPGRGLQQAMLSRDLHYNVGSAFERLHRSRGTMPFVRMTGRPGRRFEKNDIVRMMCGASKEANANEQYFRFSASGVKGAVSFGKQTSRTKSPSTRTAATEPPPLHVSYHAIDAQPHGTVPWRPSSALSSRRPETPDTDSTTLPSRSRPQSALSHRSLSTGPTLELDPLASFNSSRRSLSRNLTFSKAPRVTL